MPTRLRPLSTLEILDAAWLLLRAQWVRWYAVSGLGTAPLALATIGYFYWLGTLVADTEDAVFYRGTLLWGLGMAVGWVWNGLARGAVTVLALDTLRGNSLSLGQAWRAATRQAISITFVTLAGFSGGWLASLALVAPGLRLAGTWWVSRPIVLEEDRPFLDALRRSRQLTAGYGRKSLGLWLLCLMLWGIGGMNLHLLLKFALGTGGGLLGLDTSVLAQQLHVRNQMYVLVVGALLFVLLDPLKTLLDTLYYQDLRIRREGADLEERLRALSAQLPSDTAGVTESTGRSGTTTLITLALLLSLTWHSPTAAMPVDQYAARIRNLRRQIERAERPTQVDPSAVGSLQHAVVDLPGGQRFSVENPWLRDGLDAWESASDPAHKDALLRRLDALERTLPQPGTAAPASPTTPAPSVDARQTVRQILQAPEFQPLASRTELRSLAQDINLDQPRNWWQSFWKWLREKLFRPPQMQNPPEVRTWKGGSTLLYIFLGLLLLVALALLVRWIMERPERHRSPSAASAGEGTPELAASATENALDHSVDEWEAFAREWLRRGDVRQAIRALYLATLVHLHRERRIDYNRALTNWMYVRAFRGPGEDREALQRLTARFDAAWYGDRPLDEAQYQEFERDVRALGTPAPTTATAPK